MAVDLPLVARRFAWYSAVLLCLVALASLTYATPAPQQGCQDAQIIAMHGQWIAKPGDRHLSNWSCVSAGEQLLVADEKGGDVTVIFHRGGKAPHTVACKPRCRSAYEVKLPRASRKRNATDEVLDFFFSIFDGAETRPVPGILHGSLLLPGPAPQPILACSHGRNVDSEGPLRQVVRHHPLVPLNAQAKDVTFRLASVAENNAPGTEGGTAGVTEEERRWSVKGDSPASVLTISQSLKSPALYETAPEDEPASLSFGLKASRRTVFPALVLIAPESLCDPLLESYDNAVSFTRTWPKKTPQDAKENFLWYYALGLATQ